jgi:hypothetical protein
MPLDEYVEETYQGMLAGDEEIAAGMAKHWVGQIEPNRKVVFKQLMEAMKG